MDIIETGVVAALEKGSKRERFGHVAVMIEADGCCDILGDAKNH